MSSMAIKYALMKKKKSHQSDDDEEPSGDHGTYMAEGGMCAAHGMQACKMCHGGKMMAEGGFVHDEEASGYEDDMISSIMKKRKGYSEGGRVANDTDMEADFEPNEFDDLAKRDDLEQHYTGANSGDELGNAQEDEDERDLVSMIMKSRRKKDRMPHPM